MTKFAPLLLVLALLLASCTPSLSESLPAESEQYRFMVLQVGETDECRGEEVAGVEGFTTFALCTAEPASKARFTYPSAEAVYNCPRVIPNTTEGLRTDTCVLESEPKHLYRFYAAGVSFLDVEFDTTSGTFHFPWP